MADLDWPPEGRRLLDGRAVCGGAHPTASPVRLAAAGALTGAALRPFRRILHLDCGIGAGLAIQAAALAGTGAAFFGLAREAADAAAARRLLSAAGLDAHVAEGGPHAADGFDALAAPETAESFDLMLMPEGWDELDPAGRDRLGAFLAERLAPGGAFLCLHATPPGDIAERTLRMLLTNRHAALPAASAGDPAAALEALREMLPACHALLRSIGEWNFIVEEMEAMPPSLLHQLWIAAPGPVWAMPRMGLWARAHGLDWAGPADPRRLEPALDHSQAQLDMISAAPDRWLAQETADLCANRKRRADLFLRPGGPPADPGALRMALRPGARLDRLEAEGHLGAATLSQAVHRPVLEAIAAAGGQDGGEAGAGAGRPCGARLDAVAARLGAAIGSLTPVLAALIAADAVAPVAEPPSETARAACARLNRLLLREGAARLASPALGGAFAPDARRVKTLQRQAEAGASSDAAALDALSDPWLHPSVSDPA